MKPSQRRYDRGLRNSKNKEKCQCGKVLEIKEVFSPKSRRFPPQSDTNKLMTDRCCYVSPQLSDTKKLLVGSCLYKSPDQNDTNKVLVDNGRYKNTEQIIENKLMTDRCCYVSPQQKEIGLETETNKEQYEELLLQQYGFNPILPQTINQLKELRKVLCVKSTTKVDNSSQYDTANAENTARDPGSPLPAFAECSDDAEWINVENTDEVEHYIFGQNQSFDTSVPPSSSNPTSNQKTIHISRVPQIKTIVEKFTKVKKNNVEVRQLDERVVCVEYDVYDQTREDSTSPIQKMRAYFSVRPTYENSNGDGKDQKVLNISSDIKRRFNIDDALTNIDQEVEIIDGKLLENKPYLNDLNKVLKKKIAVCARKKKSYLDVKYLYEMATKKAVPLDPDISNSNLLSNAVLQEVKKMILEKVASSVHGFSRRLVKNRDPGKEGVLVIVEELLKETSK